MADVDGVPVPTLVVGSGSPGHRHLYWRLTVPVELRVLEDLNAGLAVRLGGDLLAGDAPRILRLAGTLNHKPPRPTPVCLDDETHSVPVYDVVVEDGVVLVGRRKQAVA